MLNEDLEGEEVKVTFTWKLENVQDKPNSREGRTAKLCCYRDDNKELMGWVYVEGWLYGCALMGLSQLNGLSCVPVSEFSNFRKFLKKLSVTLGVDSAHYNKFTAGRYMFTTAACWLGDFGEKLVKESELVKEFENLAHTSPENKLYFFNVKTKVGNL